MDKKIEHIWFIMDGNRSWAKARFLPSVEWHRRWYDNAKKIIRLIGKHGIPFVSLWALSDDNIKSRWDDEIGYLFDLLARGILEVAKEAKDEGNKIVVVWDRTLLPESCQKSITQAEKLTETEKGITIIIAVGYGWQEEIIRAIRWLAMQDVDMTKVSVEALKQQIETNMFPPPDLIVRTGWHMRHSWFFLFQSPYAEYYFSEKNWPDFDETELNKAIESFSSRERKFGK